MFEESFLKEYVINSYKEKSQRHIIYKVDIYDVINAENRMNKNFPNELREFYKNVGYGFICKDDKFHTNRIMGPSDIADYYCEDEVYSDVDRELYEEDDFIFFDLGQYGDFITISIKDGSIKYFGKKIAKSLEEFLEKMDNETNYYMKL